MTQNKRSVVSFLLTMVFFVFSVTASFAEEKKSSKTPTNKKSSAGVSAMKAGKDDDGAVRPPTPAEENKLNAELKKTLNKYSKHNPKQNVDGSISLVVAPFLMHAAVANNGPDGKLHLNCTDDSSHIKINAQQKVELPEE